PSGKPRRGGMVLRDGEYVMIRDARIESQYDADQCQTNLTIWARTDEREYSVAGKVMSLIPLRNRRKTPEGEELLTRITEGMTEYTCDGVVGYGLSEYLDQIVDGVPVGMRAGTEARWNVAAIARGVQFMAWNYGDILDAVGAVVPADKPCLIHEETTVQWGDFNRRTNNL